MNTRFDWSRVTARLLSLLLAGGTSLFPVQVMSGIDNTKHNLTPLGLGTFKAIEPTGACVFCHTPHNASPAGPLWNRALSAETYTLYTSPTLKATLNQPTGSSRLCLSCHDGTLAMGTLLRPPGYAQLTLGKMTGSGVIGTDLRDDHPISFTYDSQLAADRGQLLDPIGAPKALHLDRDGQVQCTSCHDPHVERTQFIRMDPIKGALCSSCHRPTGWPSQVANASHGHASSTQTWDGTGTNPWPSGSYTTVADNACQNCHRNHAAGHGKGLLAQIGEAANCTVCHTGAVANINFNFNTEFAKPSRHPIEIDSWTHEPNEVASSMARHVTCADCHNPHAADASTATVPQVSGPLKGVRGIDQAGMPVEVSSFQQEVCYKCHGLSSAIATGIQRQDNIRNTRLQFDPANASFHPVAAAGKNQTITANSFVAGAGLSSFSRIGCGSCHNNDAWSAGGTSPAGPHGSIYTPLLERNYNRDSIVTESPSEFAMCYKCHDRNNLTVDVIGKFPHAKHLNNSVSPTSCATCHDAHGSRTQLHLINFITMDATNSPVVTQSGSNPITFNPAARSCTLMCHGNDHAPKTY